MNGGAPAVVGSVWLNADTLGALENDLTILKIQLGNVFFRGVTTRNCALQPKKKKNIYKLRISVMTRRFLTMLYAVNLRKTAYFSFYNQLFRHNYIANFR